MEQDLEKQLQLEISQGTKTESNKRLLELLYDMFKKNDLVEIKNPMKVKTGWIYVDPEKEKVQQTDKATRRVFFGEREIKTLEPGESVVIPGWQAYIALNRMWKQYAQLNYGNDLVSKMSTSASKREFIDKAFVGLFDPNKKNSTDKEPKSSKNSTKDTPKSGNSQPDATKQTAPKQDDLGFSEEK